MGKQCPSSLFENMTIFDPVHHFITFEKEELPWLHHLGMRRLMHIGQLGAAFHVYPGATHSRYSHSLGTCAIATRMFDHLTSSLCDKELPYYRALLRFACLYHDVGHLPFSHAAESLLGNHEERLKWLFDEGCFDSLLIDLENRFRKQGVKEEVIALIEGRLEHPRYLASLLSDDAFGADRIDYLLRDAHYSGLAYGKIDAEQLIRSLYLSDTQKVEIKEEGLAAAEALSVARYWMHERLYQHPKVRAYQYHYAAIIHEYFLEKDVLKSPKSFFSVTDHDLFHYIQTSFPTFHIEALCNPEKLVLARKVSIDRYEEMKRLADEGFPVIIGEKMELYQHPVGRIRMEQNEFFWVYFPFSCKEFMC